MFCKIVDFKLLDSFREARGMDKVLEIGIVETLLSPKGDFPLNFLKNK